MNIKNNNYILYFLNLNTSNLNLILAFVIILKNIDIAFYIVHKPEACTGYFLSGTDSIFAGEAEIFSSVADFIFVGEADL